MNIFWFLYSSMTVNWISLSCGQNKTFEDVILGFGKHWSTFYSNFLTFYRSIMLIFRFILVFCVYTRTRLHAVMLKKTRYFPHTVCLNIPVFTLCLKRSVSVHLNGIALLGNSLGPCVLPVSWCYLHTLQPGINWDTFRMFTFKIMSRV